MNKRFNDTGVCIPERHYMADTSSKLAAIMDLIEEGSYFTINRPRQYGKTTIAHLLGLQLQENVDYLALELSFEGIGDVIFEKESTFCKGFLNLLIRELTYLNEELLKNYLQENKEAITNLAELSESITWLCLNTPKKVVLVIDEIDKSSNNQLFLSFLGLLRDKYLRRNRGRDSSFQSVILIGVHDVKTLKLKIAPETTDKLNSPWNIAVDFRVDMSFAPLEIQVMLEGYVGHTGVEMDTMAIAEKIYYYTAGYPFLTSKICKIIDEVILPKKTRQRWELADIEEAMKTITDGAYTTTLFDSLIKNLENDEELYQMVFEVVFNGKQVAYNILDTTVNLGVLHGFFKNEQRICKIHNRIIEQKIYSYMLSKQLRKNNLLYGVSPNQFYSKTGLKFKHILLRFQQFMKENYAQQDAKFLEREGRLLFLSFLKPIINGKGFDFKEPTIADERRLDVVITYGKHRYVVELKRWEGEVYHQKGLKQLSGYLDTYSLKKGYLLIFDFRKSKEYKEEKISFKGKDIFAVWV